MRDKIYEILSYITFAIGIVGIIIGFCSFPYYEFEQSMAIIISFVLVACMGAFLIDIKNEMERINELRYKYRDYLERKDKLKKKMTETKKCP